MLNVLAIEPNMRYRREIIAWGKLIMNMSLTEDSRREILIAQNLIEIYCKKFLEVLKEMKEDLFDMGINLNAVLPFPFCEDNIQSYGGFYSIDRKQILLLFGQTTGDERVTGFFNQTIIGNPYNHFGYNFKLEGTLIEIPSAIDIQTLDMEITTRLRSSYTFSDRRVEMDYYSTLLPLNLLVDNLRNIKRYVRNFVAYSMQRTNLSGMTDNETYIRDLEVVRNKMKKIFFDESIGELTIDNFIKENPIILEHGLSLIELKHQVEMKNVLQLYERDLKPDLIAYDLLEKNWAIVDYKKAKNSIIKNVGKVRTGFRAEVNDLENQLNDYIEYFNEKTHRDYILDRYGIEVKNPNGIGIIGNISLEEIEDFNRLMKNKMRWFKVVPYNYIYDNFCRYITDVKKYVMR